MIFLISRIALPTEPSWFMNVDSAMYYILYYAIGNLSFEIIKNFSLKKLKTSSKIVFFLGTSIALFLTIITYFKGIKFSVDIVHNLTAFLNWIPHKYIINSVFVTLSIMYIVVIFAFQITNIKVIPKIGQNTLCLCGVENITKVLIETLITILGLKLTLINPMACIIYTFICILVAHYIISPIIMETLVKPVTNLFSNSFNDFKRRINL